MIPKIKNAEALANLQLLVTFDGGERVIYDVNEDVNTINDFLPLKTEIRLFENFNIDQSRTCISWSETIDLPSDTIYEYGKRISESDS